MIKITLKKIAETLGISVSTVSKALRDYPDVNPKTKERVLELSNSLNYTPNAFAQGLRCNESKTIGVIIPSMVHYFFSSILDAILKEAENRGYMVIILQSNEDYNLEKKQVDLLINKGVDGILISLTDRTNHFKHLQKIIDYQIPLVLFDKIAKVIDCSKVVIDDIKASYNAVNFLIQKGYKRIAYFRADLNPQNSIDRFIGYKKALKDHDIKFDASLVYLCKNCSFDEGYENTQAVLNDHNTDVDAIYTAADLLAIGAINYLNEKKIKIPQQLAVFGFSNWFMSTVISPSLSSVEQNPYKMGEISIKTLLNEIDCKHKNIPITHQKIIIDTELVIRNSC